MSRTFAAAARQLSGLATRLFGWTPANFWQATPAELAAIFDMGSSDDGQPLSRAEMDALMERDNHGR